MNGVRILVVDDDPAVTASLRLLFEGRGARVESAASPEESLALLTSSTESTVDLVVQDMNFTAGTSGEEGLALLSRIRTLLPQVPVVLLTAWGSIELAVAGMKAGAADFLTKPWRNEHLLASLQTSLSLRGVRAATGASREDLYYRLNLITLELPPLRSRPGDIPLLAENVLARLRQQYTRPELMLSPLALAWMREQRWPGNVRQLQQTVERAVLVGGGDELVVQDLQRLQVVDPATQAGAGSGEGDLTLIRRTLDRCNGNITRAAAVLGISRGALYRKLEKHGLEA